MLVNLFKTVAVMAVVSVGVAACGDRSAQTDVRKPAGREWPVAGGDWNNTRFSSLNAINTETVAKLGGAWFHKFEGETSRAAPVISGGRMFVAASKGVHALDPKTGAVLWTFTPKEGSITTKGVAVGEGLVFVSLAGAGMAAVKEDTGELVWTGHIGDNPPIKGQQISAPPTYVNGLVISGMANGDFGLRGRVVALDAKTGKEAWRFHTIPFEGEKGNETWPQDHQEWKQGGGGVWMVPAVDPDLGLVYFGVGNPIPQFGGELRKGDNLYTGTAVALDLKTGQVRWHYQVVRHDIWEADLGTPLVLYDATVDGKPRKAIAIVSTYGYFYLLDRATGQPIFPIEERPVPQNARLHTAPTQPFPKGADRIGPDCMPERLIPAGFRGMCIYEPADYDLPNGMYPILTTRAAPMAYSPLTKQFYATGAIWPRWLKRPEDPKFFRSNPTIPGMKYEGLLAAMSSETNKLAWQKTVPYRTQQNGSGFMATAGGLLFHGNTDGTFDALDAVTGDVKWQFQTGFDANQPAASYEVDKEQYVTVVTSGGVWAFKLGGMVAELPAPPAPPTDAGFTGRIVPVDEIVVGPVVSDSGLEFIRKAKDEYAFEPMRARVTAGAKVTWKNEGTETHTVSAVDGSWTTGPLAPGTSKVMTFNTPGTYTYTCKEHPWSYSELTVE
jgi:PQQ-dependent dehydrogenase (methanol/ethanol family)